MSSLSNTFTSIYRSNLWGSQESVSGVGSELSATEVLRSELPIIFKKYNIKSILDIPCGDFNWMRSLDLKNNFPDIDYIGADIVSDLILANTVKYPDYKFQLLDITTSPLPKSDLVIVRDCLGHLTNENVGKALNNLMISGSKWLLTTSFTKATYNQDIKDGHWRKINLLVDPFKLNPKYLINENCQQSYPIYNDKCMILFDLENLF